jgi:hypothetical protein
MKALRTLHIAAFTLAVMLIYAGSYGPAWSIAVRFNLYNAILIYEPLPRDFRVWYLKYWIRIEPKAEFGLL